MFQTVGREGRKTGTGMSIKRAQGEEQLILLILFSKDSIAAVGESLNSLSPICSGWITD